jgi:hypothetical protein
VVADAVANLAPCQHAEGRGCSCIKQDEFMRLLGRAGTYVWAYEEPFFCGTGFSEAYEVIGPGVCPRKAIEFGSKHYPDGVTIHAVPDEPGSVHAHELVLDEREESTTSAYCEDCKRRTSCNDGNCKCFVCGSIIVCTECYEPLSAHPGRLGC